MLRIAGGLMGLRLPDGLVTVLNLTGFSWPAADEEKLYASGRRWLAFAGTMERTGHVAYDHAARLWTRNAGRDVDAFQVEWTGQEGPITQTGDVVKAARLIGGALLVAAVAVLAYKIAVISALIKLAVRFLVASVIPGAAVTAPGVIAGAQALLRRSLDATVGLLRHTVMDPFRRAAELLGRPLIRPPRHWRADQLTDRLQAAADRSVDLSRTSPSTVVWRTDRKRLWRVDDRDPDTVFEEGFKPKNNEELNLEDHLSSEPSAFVSTTRDQGLIRVWRNADQRYLIDAPGGIDVPRTVGRKHRHFKEQEVAFPGGVHRRYIMGSQRYDGKSHTYGPFIHNPHYNPEA